MISNSVVVYMSSANGSDLDCIIMCCTNLVSPYLSDSSEPIC